MQSVQKKSMGSLCAVGIMGRAFGLKGEITYRSYLRKIDDYKKGTTFFAGVDEKNVCSLTLDYASQNSKNILLKFSEINSKTEAQSVVSNFLFLPMEERVSLSKGEFFVHEIIGSTAKDEKNNILGEVVDVINLPAHKAYVVKKGNEEYYIPAVKELVKLIDIKSNVIIFAPPEGMFEGGLE